MKSNANKATIATISQKSHSTGDIEAPKANLNYNNLKNTKLKSQSQQSMKVVDAVVTSKKNQNINVQPVLDYFHGQSASDSSFQSVETNTTDSNHNLSDIKFNNEEIKDDNLINDDRLWLSSTEYDEIEQLLYAALNNPFYLSYDDAVQSSTPPMTFYNKWEQQHNNNDIWNK
jgi:hypothetical protein